MDDAWLNMAAKLFEGSLEDLFRVNDSKFGVRLEIWHQLSRIFIVDANSLGQNGRGLVAGVVLVEADHSLLADVLRALE
jgi:hypothetical protein